MKKALLVVLAVILCVLLWFYFQPRDVAAPELSKGNTETAAPQVITKVEPVQPDPFPADSTAHDQSKAMPQEAKAVTLDDSDKTVISVFEKTAPGMLTWLAPNELIRRFVINVSALLEGKVPNDFRLIEKKIPEFKSTPAKLDQQFYVDKNNYKRLTPLVDTVIKMPKALLVDFYVKHYALFQKAYMELGLDGEFNTKLLALMDKVINASEPTDNSLLKRESVTYTYANRAYEEATPLQKALWRLGSTNLNKLKKYTSDVKELIVKAESQSAASHGHAG